jgi:hypothetical protein
VIGDIRRLQETNVTAALALGVKIFWVFRISVNKIVVYSQGNSHDGKNDGGQIKEDTEHWSNI